MAVATAKTAGNGKPGPKHNIELTGQPAPAAGD